MDSFKLDFPNKNNEKTVYVSGFIPESVVKRLEVVKDSTTLEQVIETEFKHVKNDIKNSLDLMGDNVIMFKAEMIKYRNAYKEALETELNANYQLWESYDIQKSELKNKIKSTIDTLQPLRNELANLKEELNQISKLANQVNDYQINRLIETIKNLTLLNDSNKEMIDFLIKNFKKE